MSYELRNIEGTNVTILTLHSRLRGGDYHDLCPLIYDQILWNGTIRLLIASENYDHIESMWEDLRFDHFHKTHFQRLAIVCPKSAQEKVMKLTKNLSNTDMIHFDTTEKTESMNWLLSETETEKSDRLSASVATYF